MALSSIYAHQMQTVSLGQFTQKRILGDFLDQLFTGENLPDDLPVTQPLVSEL